MWQKIKCKLGFHWWGIRDISPSDCYRECISCGRFEFFYPWVFEWGLYDKKIYDLMGGKEKSEAYLGRCKKEQGII